MAELKENAVYRYRWVILAAMWGTYMSSCIARLAIPALSPFLMEEPGLGGLGLTYVEVGWWMSAAQISGLIIKIPAGFVIDAVGVRPLILIGKIAAGICFALMFFASSYNSGFLILFLAGIGGGLLGSVTYKAIVYWFPFKERATAIGISGTAFNVGGIIGAAILPTLALYIGWRYDFVVIGSIIVGIGILAFVLYRRHPEEPKMSEAGAIFNKSVIREVFANRNMLLVSLSGLLFCVLEFSVITYITVYMTEVPLSHYLDLDYVKVLAAGFLATAEAGCAFAKPIFGFLSDRLFGGSRKALHIIIIVIGIIMTLVVAYLPPATPLWLLTFIFVVMGLTLIGWASLAATLLTEFSGKKRTGVGVSFGFLMHGVGQIFGPPIFGYIVESASWTWGWYFLSICGLAGVVMLFFIKEGQRKV